MRAIALAAALSCLPVWAAGALAEPPCDQFCTVIKRALEARSSDFAALRGTRQSSGPLDTWTSNVSLPGMPCSLVHYDEKAALSLSMRPKGRDLSQFRCITELGSPDGRKHLSSVFAAFRQSAPKWKWFKEDPDFLGTTSYYGGPTKEEIYAYVSFQPIQAGLTEFDLNSVPITIPAGSPVKPYMP
jgi:hypothetical protein